MKRHRIQKRRLQAEGSIISCGPPTGVFVWFTSALVCSCMLTLSTCRAFPQQTIGSQTKAVDSSRLFASRRKFLLTTAATIAFFPARSVDAYQEGSNSLEDLQFAKGRWNSKSTQTVLGTESVQVPACFTTYLTRFLINYDDGVSSWWDQLQVSYSLLTEEQRQSRLGRDFGSLAASIQEAVQVYLQRAATNQQGYEELFQRFASVYATENDEAKRQLCLLAATLPADQQPQLKGFLPTERTSVVKESPSLIKDSLSTLLPNDYFPVFSDGSLAMDPRIGLYQVGVGEEFGQAATATTFGPLALNGLMRELPNYTFDIYALFGISGATGCALTHSVVIPLDVVKTRAQTSTQSSTLTIASDILSNEGISGLLTGAQATLAGYFWYGISVYPSYAFFKRFLAHSLLSPDVAVAHTNDIALVAGALAAVVASLGLTPLEAARIRVVSEPSRYRPKGLIGTLQAIGAEGKEEGTSSLEALYKGLPSLMTRQVIFGSVKFLAFERACEAIYQNWPMLRDATWTALTVSLVAGAFSGALSCLVSQPADAVLTYVAQESKNAKGLGVLEGSILMIEESGVSSLFRGLGSRSLWAASIISGQFLLYDVFRNYFGVNSDDLSQIFQIDL